MEGDPPTGDAVEELAAIVEGEPGALAGDDFEPIGSGFEVGVGGPDAIGHGEGE
jgi:hypothetical protein